MSIAMAADFMTGHGDLPRKLRKFLGHPTKDEKGSLCCVFLEQFKDTRHVVFNPSLISIPLVIADLCGKRFDMKIVFNIDTQHIQHFAIPFASGVGAYEPFRTSTVFTVLRMISRSRAQEMFRSEEHTSELQSQSNLVCRLLLEKKKKKRV